MGRPRIRILNIERPAHETYLDELVAGMAALGYAERSLTSHYWTARRFLDWTEQHGAGRIEAITSADLEAYRERVKNEPSLKDGGPVSDKTVYQNLRTVQLLFDHLLGTGKLAADPFATFPDEPAKTWCSAGNPDAGRGGKNVHRLRRVGRAGLAGVDVRMRSAGRRVGAAERGRSTVG
jgi:hypothetical protein